MKWALSSRALSACVRAVFFFSLLLSLFRSELKGKKQQQIRHRKLYIPYIPSCTLETIGII